MEMLGRVLVLGTVAADMAAVQTHAQMNPGGCRAIAGRSGDKILFRSRRDNDFTLWSVRNLYRPQGEGLEKARQCLMQDSGTDNEGTDQNTIQLLARVQSGFSGMRGRGFVPNLYRRTGRGVFLGFLDVFFL